MTGTTIELLRMLGLCFGMVTFASYALAALAGLLAIPVAMFCLEISAAIALPRRERPARAGNEPRRRIAVLVPAHNESTGLRPTIDDIRAQLHAGDRLLVVADNCSDDTAAVAAAAGAEVVARHDPYESARDMRWIGAFGIWLRNPPRS